MDEPKIDVWYSKTGRKFTPDEFRELDSCGGCGKRCKLLMNECDECLKNDFKKCEICEFALWTGLRKFYSYDNRETHRDTGAGFLASKEMVWEFMSEEESKYPPISETRCEGCRDFPKGMKDICFWCDNDFNNSEKNYKLNGNTCEQCVYKFEVAEFNATNVNQVLA